MSIASGRVSITISTSGFSPGNYVLEVVHYYGDSQTASAQATFTVKAQSSEGIPLWIIVGFMVTMVVIILFLFWFLKTGNPSAEDQEHSIERMEDEIEDIDKIRDEVDKKLAKIEEENWQSYG